MLGISDIAVRLVKYTGPVILSGIEVRRGKKISVVPDVIIIKNVKKSIKTKKNKS